MEVFLAAAAALSLSSTFFAAEVQGQVIMQLETKTDSDDDSGQ